jgi:hypothetical protein
MGAPLLMAHQHMFEPTPLFGEVKFVVYRQNRTTWIAKDVLNPMAMQSIHKGIGAAHLGWML